MTFSFSYKTSLFALSLGAFFIVSPAYSGFEWIPPEQPAAQETKQAPVKPATPSPVPSVQQQVLQAPAIQPTAAPAQAPAPMPQASTGAPTSIIPGVVQQKTVEAPSQEPMPKHQATPKTVHMTPKALPVPAPTATPKPQPQKTAEAEKPKPVVTSPTPILMKKAEQPAQQEKVAQAPAPITTPATSPSPKKMGLKINPFPRNSDGFKPAASPVTPAAPAPMPAKAIKTAPAAPAITTAPAASQAPSSEYEVIAGFGADIPLALALRQVVPPAYAYSFSDGVNPGLRVSWDGNKPWNTVVDDMLKPLNLHANIIGQTIVIAAQKKTKQPQQVSLRRKNIVDPGPGDMAKFRNSIIKAEPKTPEPAQEKPTKSNEHVAYKPPPITQTKTVETVAAKPPIAPKIISLNTANSKQWTAWRGDDLQTTLNAWGKKEGALVQWNASRDYKLIRKIDMNVPFDQAVKGLALQGFRDSSRPSIQISDNGKTVIVNDPAA